MDDEAGRILALDSDERRRVAERKATCPFVGSLVAEGLLAVSHSAADPLARLEDIRRLGNGGGGDLGDLLVLFAAGNHAYMRGAGFRLTQAVPAGFFSLSFPGSQGSHPGHSGILEGDPRDPEAGRASAEDFARLAAHAREGWITRAEVGRFIAENLRRDPTAKVFDSDTARELASDLGALALSGGRAWLHDLLAAGDEAGRAYRQMEQKLTALLGADNLVGAAGEFGLLFAFFAHQPGAREIDGEPALELALLHGMFLDQRLPPGWESWPKSRVDWVRHTTALLLAAAKDYLALKRLG